MELRRGYKRTEAGVIPEDWDVRPLDALYELRNGVNANREAYGKGVPFINVLEPISYSHLYGPEITGKVTLAPPTIASYAVKKGDVVFNRTSETDSEVGLAAAYLGQEEVVFGGFVIRGHATDDSLDPLYAGYALRARPVRSQIIPLGQGAVRSNISQQNLGRISVAVPPIAEQHAIAGALTDVDRFVSALDRLIAKKRDLKQAAMQQLLTGKNRLPGFTGEWDVCRLGDIGLFLKGSGVTKNQAISGTLPCVRYGELYTRHDNVIRLFFSWISAPVASTATRLVRGDILFAGSGETKDEIGKCAAFVDDLEVYAGGDVVILRPWRADPVFLGYLLNSASVVRQKASRGQGDAVVHISASALAAIECRFPQMDEQTAIAAVLSDMDAELSALEVRRDKTRALKQAMMQELLTGRTRLV